MGNLSETADNVTIQQRNISIHKTLAEYVRIIFMYLVHTGVMEMCVVNCLGCQNDSPGQMAHMNGGCLTFIEEAIDQYAIAVKLTVPESQMVYIEEQLYLRLGLPSRTLPTQEILDILKSDPEIEDDLLTAIATGEQSLTMTLFSIIDQILIG
ncbi:unnamed protein product [Owenia fusiformis]|uniref:Uncharacterized protein n=1 Tax=Owenia fusiformis TaxID=6347 RepID=A0A8S4QBD7_OWEFU|nr:unnamed protein product [Owenia fusiformis]